MERRFWSNRGGDGGWRNLLSGGESELVPQTRLAGPMPWVIAIMVALTVIAAAAGLALRNAARSAAAELSGGITVQIVEASPVAREAQASAALRALRKMPDIASAQRVPADEIDALVEPWLGSAGGDRSIPVPALIDARTSGTVSADQLARWQNALRRAAPSARVDAQSSWLAPVFEAIQSLQWLALALAGLLIMAMSAAVLLATRTALGNNRETIEVVHLLGGSDRQIAAVFQRSIGIDAAGGGLVGLALGVVVVLFLGRRFASLGAGLVSGGALGWGDWAALALIPLACVVLAVLTARISVLRALKGML